MVNILMHILSHAVIDSVKMLPFLFLAYLFIEYIEHKGSSKTEALLAKAGRFGPAIGAILGCVPQCGFSVAAANLYAGGVATAGTVVAVFLSTSDEAIPVLLSHPDQWGVIGKLIGFKLVIAVAAGFILDLIERRAARRSAVHRQEASFHIHKEICGHCGCERHGIFRAAIKHTLQIFLFILLITFLLNALIEWLGEDRLSSVLLGGSFLQPAIAAIFGLIPNCAASVVLTQLFLEGTLSFGSVLAGLCAGAGVGLLVLFKVNRNVKQNVKILAIVYLVSAAAGILVQLAGI